MAVVIFGAEGIGLGRWVDQLQLISDEQHQEITYIPTEIPHDWQNKVIGYTENPLQDLEVKVRSKLVNKMVLVLNHNPRKFNDWLEFVQLFSERMQSNLQNFIASHLLIALNVNEEDFECKRRQIDTLLNKIYDKSSLNGTENIIHIDQRISKN